MRFERYLEDNLFSLYEELITRRYRHQPYTTFHVWDPKFRVIRKAEVRDRVVHHLVFRYLESIFEPRFIFHSYSCRREKGIHAAANDVAKALRQASGNYRDNVWSLKMDVKKFFDSVDHEILLKLLWRRVGNQTARRLLQEIVHSYHSPAEKGKGLPIGNLTSQIFANVYLHELDHFVKHHLRLRWYFRYADDFLFLHRDRTFLEWVKHSIERFLADSLRLTVHPQKVWIRKFSQGIDFVGFVLRPYYQVIRTSTKQRMFKRMSRHVADRHDGRMNDTTFNQALRSYIGMLSHGYEHRTIERLKNDVWVQK